MSKAKAYIRFEERAVEDRKESIKQGHYVAKDEDYIVIVPPGDSKTVLEQKVDDKIRYRYKKEYQAWKEGREIPIEGTSVKDWTQTSPAMVENLLRAQVRTVEQLANCNESTLERIGMGARALKNKAVAWLEASEGPGKMSEAMAEITRRMDEMDVSKKENEDTIAELRAENERLRSNENAKEATVGETGGSGKPGKNKPGKK